MAITSNSSFRQAPAPRSWAHARNIDRRSRVQRQSRDRKRCLDAAGTGAGKGFAGQTIYLSVVWISQPLLSGAPLSTVAHDAGAALQDAAAENPGYRLFRDALDRGDLQPGMVLTQSDLCQALGMSLSPLRETLVLLQSFGLVEVKPRTGIQIVYPDVAFIRENFQFRIMIEVHALRIFAQTDIAAWLAAMIAAHDQSTRDLSDSANVEAATARFVAIDRRCHADIVGVLRNEAISGTHRRLQENIGMARLTHKRTPFRQQLLDTVQEHRAMLVALAAGDIDSAVAALEAHFRASTHRTFAA